MIGIDEVGRGCWAGPLLVVAARPTGMLPTLADSKQLSKLKRQALYGQLLAVCEFGEGWVDPTEIDSLGLTKAMQLGVWRALDNLDQPLKDSIIMDGHINYCPSEYINVECVVRADALHPAVSAASIYAKVKRDKYMKVQSCKYPAYGFEKHVGYGTLQHREALKHNPITEIHRRSFKPIRALL